MCSFAYVQHLLADGYLLTFVTTPTPIPPSAAALIRYLPYIQGGIIVFPPSILHELYSLGPEAVKAAAGSITLAMYGGAPLKKDVGDALVAAGLSIGTVYGSYVCNERMKSYEFSQTLFTGQKLL
jgi:hypothetical protein